MELLEGIATRRSIRRFTDKQVEREALIEVVQAGCWAPSGLNNQPWRFVIVRDHAMRRDLAAQTKYAKVIEGADACIVVLVDKEAMYHPVKDHQAMGACIQNMLLAAHALGLGAVWLGEILKNAHEVLRILSLPDTLELMAVVALGHPAGSGGMSSRKPLGSVLLKEL